MATKFVTLNDNEIQRATSVARARTDLETIAGTVPRTTEPWVTGIDAQLQQAGAELAVAVAMHQEWEPTDVFPDGTGHVGKLHVEWGRDGALLVDQDTADDEIFVAVRGTLPNFELCGWMRAAEAKASPQLKFRRAIR